ncbi:hypothetical protein PAI11_08260 [Patulibacter medicamentivorans]|uniref:Uncharacterized protein n=1 Tax=Patulibacter medicamentivorans TaxID=1097667 RepID=H0E213_9ACTN|nr:hypothetical protein PAI11_08260 [Patulibacter medicamentivorans]
MQADDAAGRTARAAGATIGPGDAGCAMVACAVRGTVLGGRSWE